VGVGLGVAVAVPTGVTVGGGSWRRVGSFTRSAKEYEVIRYADRWPSFNVADSCISVPAVRAGQERG
jgi:hypothetical protein